MRSMGVEAVTLFTVGHSNCSLQELIDLLTEAGVTTLVDVRAQPHSSRHPQFEGEVLRGAAEDAGMVYHWAGRQLGGRRQAVAGSPHVALAEDGLRGYADYMDTESFRKAAAQLIQLAGRAPTAVLCAERLPEHCHRSLLADYLTLQGVKVVHLAAPADFREHQLSPTLRRDSATLIYDRNVSGRLDLH